MFYDFLKYLFREKKKVLIPLLVILLLSIGFFVNPNESLRLFVRGFSLVFFVLGLMRTRTTSYDPTIKVATRKKSILTFFLFAFSLLLLLVPIFLSQLTEFLLGSSLALSGAYFLLQMRKNFFNLFDCFKKERGQIYLLLFVIGSFQIINSFFAFLSVTDLLALLLFGFSLYWFFFLYIQYTKWPHE